MAAQLEEYYTPEEYLAIEEQAEIRHEFVDGEIYDMAGSTINHNTIVGNAAGELRIALRGKSCRVFSTDVKVATRDRRFCFYPDVFVVCGKIEAEPKRQDIVRNPILVMEGLSHSTQSFDKAQKFEWYRSIPSMQEYVMIEQTRVYVEHYRKEGRFWVFEALNDLNESLSLLSIGVTLSIASLYENVEF